MSLKEPMCTSYPDYNCPLIPSQPRIMERRGGIIGANCVLTRILDSNITIIILSNNNEFNPDSFGETESLREALRIEVGSI